MKNLPYQTFRTALGQLVRNEREAQGISLRKFGLMIGLDYKRIHEIEHGEANATINSLLRISEGLGVPLSEFVYAAEERAAAAKESEKRVAPLDDQYLAEVNENDATDVYDGASAKIRYGVVSF